MTDPLLICTTARLTVRRLTPDDAAFMVKLLNEPSFIENIGDRGVRTDDEARAFLANGPIASYDRHGFGLFRVDLTATGEAIGICGLLQRDWLDDPDVGFAFLPQHWSKGYAYESSLGIIDWGRRTFGIEKVVGFTKPDNTGSMRVLEKLGMRFEKMVTSPEGQVSRFFSPPSRAG